VRFERTGFAFHVGCPDEQNHAPGELRLALELRTSLVSHHLDYDAQQSGRSPMTLSRITAILALVLFLSACGDSGGSSDPKDASEACENFCDRLGDCEVEGFEGEKDDCDEYCENVDEEENEVWKNCEEAAAALFNCVVDLKCSELSDVADKKFKRGFRQRPITGILLSNCPFPGHRGQLLRDVSRRQGA
jgi:hypothetical protein